MSENWVVQNKPCVILDELNESVMAGFPLMLLPAEYAAGPAVVVVFYKFQLSIKSLTFFLIYLWPL